MSIKDKSYFESINEDITQTPSMPEENPFWIPQYGRTYPNKNYHQASLNSNITRVEYILSGNGIINSKNYSCIVSAGDTYILHQNDHHNYYSDNNDPWDKIWVNIKGNLALELLRIYKLDDVILFKNVDSSEWIYKMQEICKNNTDPYVIQRKSSAVFCELIHFLSMQHKNNQNKSDFLNDIRAYIDSHIYENISINDLCTHSNKSVNHTIRLFKEKFGITPHQYMIKLKLHAARTMLPSHNLSIEKIAEKVNFCNVGHFSDLFYKHYGMRPSEYRK